MTVITVSLELRFTVIRISHTFTRAQYPHSLTVRAEYLFTCSSGVRSLRQEEISHNTHTPPVVFVWHVSHRRTMLPHSSALAPVPGAPTACNGKWVGFLGTLSRARHHHRGERVQQRTNDESRRARVDDGGPRAARDQGDGAAFLLAPSHAEAPRAAPLGAAPLGGARRGWYVASDLTPPRAFFPHTRVGLRSAACGGPSLPRRPSPRRRAGALYASRHGVGPPFPFE